MQFNLAPQPNLQWEIPFWCSTSACVCVCQLASARVPRNLFPSVGVCVCECTSGPPSAWRYTSYPRWKKESVCGGVSFARCPTCAAIVKNVLCIRIWILTGHLKNFWGHLEENANFFKYLILISTFYASQIYESIKTQKHLSTVLTKISYTLGA